MSSGELDVRPADVDELTVKRWYSVWSMMGSDPEPTWELNGDELTLAADCGPAVLTQCEAKYEVLVPRSAAVTVDGGSGAITAAGFDTALQITSDNGAVRVKDASARLTLHGASGDLRATGITSDRVDARSENGQIHLTFAEVPDKVGTRAENGAVTVEVPDTAYDVTTETDSGEVHSDLAKDAASSHRITARTDNGSIRLRATD